MTITRNRVLITGAAGGMGRACARLLGATHDLVLTDVAQAALDGFAGELAGEGYAIAAARAGDLGDAALLARLADDVAEGAAFELIHAAGLSPSLGDWRAIMAVNLVATDRLLDAIEPRLRAGSAAVVIASTAGHAVIPVPGLAELCDAPQAADFLDRVGPTIEAIGAQSPGGAAGIGYCLSKAAVIRQCERRAAAWGRRGARIMSLSPGVILTPMGRSEIANTEGAAQLRDMAPMGRAGTAMDIALAVRFLLGDGAGFITGCDLRVDGGATAAVNQAARG